ncbi:serine/threonine protein kinase [Dictyobacter kobayashii]|uniref:Protein kinase domain-containing protein n=1 Tax=Dictyobacter kobayashii TaxID=2014872 RepID=A0A402ATA0_9CHLR|nr:serine/threonine-protein kinase [Dictyobacter kobayashii]GCE22299.1 hypothetical protein KDK_60990 [Dictyobacter kobayashii]
MASLIGTWIGQRLGNYQLKQLVGQGGFAEVYLGEHIYLKTPVAIKVLSTQLAQEDQEGFLNEARIIAHLKHPDILSILEFGVQEGTPFLVMDYAPNGSLRERYRRQAHLTPIMVLPHVKQVAAALQYAHQEHIIHRDVKPENILLGAQDEALLSDFGMALGTRSSRTQNMEELAGTLAYMAPEMLQGRPVPASDQYALAIVLYEWLSGDYPFHGTFTEIASQHLMVPPPPIKNPAVSPEVEAVILRALAKRPEQRFESVQAFADAFEQSILEVGRTFRAPSGWLPPGVYQQLRTAPSIEGQPTIRESSLPTKVQTPTEATAILPPPPTKIVRSRKGLPRSLTIALVVLVLLTITGGLILAYSGFGVRQPASKGQVQISTPSTAAGSISAADWQNRYEQVTSQKPFLTDPLSQNVNGWDSGVASNRSCLFTRGAYHVSSLKPYALGLCGKGLNDKFSNIAYQVQMTILRGNEGGLSFRLSVPSSTQVLAYIFDVNRNGTYNLWSINGHYEILLYRSSSLIKTSLNQPNLLCVIAQGNQIALYINKHYVASIVDRSAATGSIGLFARSLPATTEVAFSNLTLWRL